MVELCELKIFPETDEWPSDIDARVAQLDFGTGDSLLFASVDPSVSTDSLDSEQLRERCRHRPDDFQLAFADSGHWPSGIVQQPNSTSGHWGVVQQPNQTQLITWGRIQSAEPLDDRVASAPDVRSSFSTHLVQNRPSSLLANFVDSRRYVDVNDNEIALDRWQNARQTNNRSRDGVRTPRDGMVATSSAPTKPRRTFADLQKTCAPELNFLALTHKMPSLCDSSMSLSEMMLRVRKEGSLPPITTEIEMNAPPGLQDDTPDSGLGCSGPSHIEDWSSLSILLPKHVAEACSFFKSHSELLTGSETSSQERSRCNTDRLSSHMRTKTHGRNCGQSASTRTFLCDCSSSDKPLMPRTARPSTHDGLRPRELSLVGLPVYAAKRVLVEAVVEAVAEVSRGADAEVLVRAMEGLVADGLMDGIRLWQVITTLTAPGPATKDVYSIVKRLDASEKSDSSRIEIFFEHLLRENSLDCWLCYVILKEHVLKGFYNEDAFLLSAPSAYRSLLYRLTDSLALFPVLETRENVSASMTTRSLWSSRPSRLAADSRVPKSSSVPARLSQTPFFRRPSRIPLPLSRPELSRTLSPARGPMASVSKDVASGSFHLSQGERVRVLSRRGSVATCARVTPLHSSLTIGRVPLDHLIIH